MLSQQERQQIIAETAKMKTGKMKFFYGCTSNNTETTIDYLRFARANGADGAILAAPAYICGSEADIEDYFLEVADATDLPLGIYNNPPRVKTDLPGTAQTASGRVDVVAANLSATGTLLQSGSALGKEGEEFSLALPIELYQVKSELSLRCKIKTQRSAPESGGDHRTGVEFLDPQPNETMILQSLVHYELVKNPYSVV